MNSNHSSYTPFRSVSDDSYCVNLPIYRFYYFPFVFLFFRYIICAMMPEVFGKTVINLSVFYLLNNMAIR